MALAYCANHETEQCNPKIETLCAMTCFGRTAVKESLADLEADGYIERERRPGFGWSYGFPQVGRETAHVGREATEGGPRDGRQEPEENLNPLSVSENGLQDGLFVVEDSLTDVSLPSNGTNGAVAEVYAYWRDQRGKSRSNYERISPARADKIRLRLKEFTVDDLKHAIEGVGHDPWPERTQHDDLTIIFRNKEQVDKFLELYRDPPRKPGKDEGGMIARAMAERNKRRGLTK
jgi:Helix-turn-helix domain